MINVFVFSVLMKVRQRTKGPLKDKHNALSMAFDAMKVPETTEFGPPNYIAFLTVTRAVNRLSSHEPERTKIMASVVERCAEGGYVSKLRIVAEAAQESKELESAIKQLHPNWIRNVPSRDRPSIGKAT